MSYLVTHTSTSGTVKIIGDYWTRTDAAAACTVTHAHTWESAIGADRFIDPRYQYDRGAFSQWDGAARVYVHGPDGNWAHYDIAELTRNAGDKGSEN